jgi:hypothetical protein
VAAVRWRTFATERPDLADAARTLLYQFGVGLAFLGTVRADGGPRIHPVCPMLEGDGLYAFLVSSPKRDDLVRDGRYALHSFPAEDNEDAIYFTGTARRLSGVSLRRRLEARFVEERPQLDHIGFTGQDPFEFLIDRCLLTRTSGHGDPAPRHEVWRTSSASR